MLGSEIDTINSNAEVSLDLLSLNKYKSSYVTMQELLDHFFPPVSLLVQSGGEEYTDCTYWRDTPQELDDFSATDSEEEEEPADDELLEDDEMLEDEDADEEEYDDELSDGEGSQYLDDGTTDLGASYISQASEALSNPAGSIVESIEGDQDLEDLGGLTGGEHVGVGALPAEPAKSITLPLRPKSRGV